MIISPLSLTHQIDRPRRHEKHIKHFLTTITKGNHPIYTANKSRDHAASANFYAGAIPPNAILGRHCFWANFPIRSYEPPVLDNFIKAKTIDVQKWLGLGLDTPLKSSNNFRSDQALRNCVHPKLGLHVFNEMPKNLDSGLSAAKVKLKAILLKQKQHEVRY